jgi:hypothetical protein
MSSSLLPLRSNASTLDAFMKYEVSNEQAHQVRHLLKNNGLLSHDTIALQHHLNEYLFLSSQYRRGLSIGNTLCLELFLSTTGIE